MQNKWYLLHTWLSTETAKAKTYYLKPILLYKTKTVSKMYPID